jgi:hypothetical protein
MKRDYHRQQAKLRALCETCGWIVEERPAGTVRDIHATMKRGHRMLVRTPWRDTWAEVLEDELAQPALRK